MLYGFNRADALVIKRTKTTFFEFGDLPVENTCWDLELFVELIAAALNNQMTHLRSIPNGFKADGFDISNFFVFLDFAELQQIIKA